MAPAATRADGTAASPHQAARGISRRRLAAGIAAAALALPAPGRGQETGAGTAWPTTGWREADPAGRGVDPALLEEAARRVEAETPLLSSLLVARGGDLVFERYWNGQDAGTPLHVWSVTKSVTSLAVGVAVADGALRLDQTLGDLIPGRIPSDTDPRAATVTVEQLLTMASGWAWDARTDYARLEEGPDWAAKTLALPVVCEPGACFEYNSGNAHLLSVAVQTATGRPLADLVQERLFDPMGIARPAWRSSPQGETAGGFGLELAPRDLAKVGLLALRRGAWDGRQLVAADWIDAATTARRDGTGALSGANLGNAAYGYLWWVTEVAGEPAFFALGYGEEVVYVVPGRDLVVVATTLDDVPVEQLQFPRPIIEGLIVPATASG
jgi:CubicO group peptidase (beta-lactamase class C family)